MAIWGARKADLVAESLLRRIVAGELAVGSLLPKEAELAAAFEVNRSVIREAIKRLEAHRLVRPVKRLGTVVLDPLKSSSADVLGVMLEPRPGVIDRQALAELAEVRATLDAEITALAAERRTEADLRAMDDLVAELRGALGDSDRYAELMGELSLAIARATQNRIYVMMSHWHRHVRGDSDPVTWLVRLANEAHLSGVEHMIGLIRQGDPEPARAFVTSVHAWLTPKLITAASLSDGAPGPEVLEGLKS